MLQYAGEQQRCRKTLGKVARCTHIALVKGTSPEAPLQVEIHYCGS